MTTIRAWHFISDDFKLRDGSEAVVGETYTHEGEIKICESGLHASRDPFDALQYAPGSVICLVQCWGDIVEKNDKLVCRNRKILGMKKIDKELRPFSRWCTRQFLPLLRDERRRNAVKIADRFARGGATMAEFYAVLFAGWDASWGTWVATVDAQRVEFRRIVGEIVKDGE